MPDAIVCGGGAAGLATAAMLGRVGVAVTVLERSDSVAASWRGRYDGLRLNTPGWMSTMPGYRRGLDSLVGHLGVLDEDGIPLVSGGTQHPSAPGLFFNGYRALLSGQLRPMRFDARAIAAAVSGGRGSD